MYFIKCVENISDLLIFLTHEMKHFWFLLDKVNFFVFFP